MLLHNFVVCSIKFDVHVFVILFTIKWIKWTVWIHIWQCKHICCTTTNQYMTWTTRIPAKVWKSAVVLLWVASHGKPSIYDTRQQGNSYHSFSVHKSFAHYGRNVVLIRHKKSQELWHMCLKIQGGKFIWNLKTNRTRYSQFWVLIPFSPHYILQTVIAIHKYVGIQNMENL